MSVTSVSGSSNVQSAIATASQRTGIDFGYLMGQAKLESGLNASARAGTSSASGLYQFIDQSWLGVVKQHGGEHGLGWAADSITRNASGHFTVADASTRQAILALRNDPGVASLMAAEHASDNKTALEGTLGRPASGTDLYMAHFLGLGGAKSFLSAMQAAPDRAGATMFPAAARANRNVFYAADGSPRSLQQIYRKFADKLDSAVAQAPADGGTAAANTMQLMAQALDMGDGATVVTGHGESGADAVKWAQSTMAQIEATRGTPLNVLKPTPDTARLAYLMLASMGG